MRCRWGALLRGPSPSPTASRSLTETKGRKRVTNRGEVRKKEIERSGDGAAQMERAATSFRVRILEVRGRKGRKNRSERGRGRDDERWRRD